MRNAEVISRIADRVMTLVPGDRGTKLDIVMDIDHADMDVGLDLEAMLYADDHNFLHDVLGIIRHMNRTTGKLENCFLPRYSK